MTLKQAAKGIVTAGGGIYRIGFMNDEGNDDETEFDAYDIHDLYELYQTFCKENHFPDNTVAYVERS